MEKSKLNTLADIMMQKAKTEKHLNKLAELMIETKAKIQRCIKINLMNQLKNAKTEVNLNEFVESIMQIAKTEMPYK